MSDSGETTMLLLMVCCMSFLCCVMSIGGTYFLAKDSFNKMVKMFTDLFVGGSDTGGDTTGGDTGLNNTGGNTGSNTGGGNTDTGSGNTGNTGNTGSGIPAPSGSSTTTYAPAPPPPPGGGCTESSWKQCPDSGCCYQGQCAKTETCFGCVGGSENCICKGDLSCSAGLQCVNNKCVKAPTGSTGTSCTGSTWDACPATKCCIDGHCQPTEQCFGCNTPGKKDCICRSPTASGGYCDNGLSCQDGWCRGTPTGTGGGGGGGGGSGEVPAKRLVNYGVYDGTVKYYLGDQSMSVVKSGGIGIDTDDNVNVKYIKAANGACLTAQTVSGIVPTWKVPCTIATEWRTEGPLIDETNGNVEYWALKSGSKYLCADKGTKGLILRNEPSSYDCYWHQARD